MLKRIFSLVFLISFLSMSFCFAADADSNKISISNIWNDWSPKITEYWGITLNWISNDMKPWIEKNIGTKAREEFEREFSEALTEIPVVIKNVWDGLRGMFN